MTEKDKKKGLFCQETFYLFMCKLNFSSLDLDSPWIVHFILILLFFSLFCNYISLIHLSYIMSLFLFFIFIFPLLEWIQVNETLVIIQ